MTDEALWPARNVAEYAYCPRLFYFMEVEGIHLPSADTVKGVTVHKRVDRPSAVTPNDSDSDDERPKIVRSLTLTSVHHGLTATLDLAEIQSNNAVPIEYRKGRPRRVYCGEVEGDEEFEQPPLPMVEPWPTDRAQIGLQVILLEEAGYEVSEAVLYYASEKRRLTIPVNDELKEEAVRVLKDARECARGERPLPLLNDARCPRCSLQPICLPDEINFGRNQDRTKESTPRKIWPPRDDGAQLIVQHYGAKIGVRGQSIRVSDRNGKSIKDVPIAGLESVSVLGAVQVSTQALHALCDRRIPVAYLSGAGRLIGILDPLDSVSERVRRSQVCRLEEPGCRLAIAQALIAAKITNQRTLLMRNCDELPPAVVSELKREAERAGEVETLDSVRGHEGRAAHLYFRHFSDMLKGSLAEEFQANGRKRRPPPDPVNACLSMAYSMLTHECIAALRLARLEPTIGAFHSSRPGRPSLALDLMEPFRPLIADSVAISAFNRGELGEGHFLRTAAGCAFTDAGRRAFFKALGRRMDTVVTHPVFEYRLSYRRMLGLHARMLAAWLLNEIPTLEFLTTR